MENLELKTPYQWCLEHKIRVLDLNEWPLEWYGSRERHYFEFPTMTKDDFIEALSKCKVKANSIPRKTEDYLEYRMYGLVNYQLSGTIHAGIQFAHALVEYGQLVKGVKGNETIYNNWADKDKTIIILNGGTTNENVESKWYGSLQKNRDYLVENGVLLAEFREPDLNDTLTAICFLVDERVWNKTLYEDFQEEKLPYNPRRKPTKREELELEERNETNYQKWVDKIGTKNAFLREFLKPFRLA